MARAPHASRLMLDAAMLLLLPMFVTRSPSLLLATPCCVDAIHATIGCTLRGHAATLMAPPDAAPDAIFCYMMMLAAPLLLMLMLPRTQRRCQPHAVIQPLVTACSLRCRHDTLMPRARYAYALRAATIFRHDDADATTFRAATAAMMRHELLFSPRPPFFAAAATPMAARAGGTLPPLITQLI